MLLLMFAVQGGGGGGGYANAFTDLNFAFVHHLATLRAANAGADASTLIAKDIPIVRTAVSAGNKDDLDTAYAEYLLTNN